MIKSIIISAMIVATGMTASAQWKAVGDSIRTAWAENISPALTLPEYPRPIMQRPQWKNLNGLWQYAITDRDCRPEKFDGNILVPFPVESSLSGVGKRLDDKHHLWYNTTFTTPSDWKDKNVLLHFGAVDWQTDVWVNDVKVGSHTGGYAPFSFDITPALKSKGENTVTVKVWDPTDKGYQPHGKQVMKPHGILYTPVSGIWQTVWLEPVPQRHIVSLRTTPDIDRSTLTVEAPVSESRTNDMVEVTVSENGKRIASGRSLGDIPVVVEMPRDHKLWSPDSPNLYDVKVTVTNGGKTIDEVTSYAAMRKFDSARDKNGIMRMRLNNKSIFQFGPLDQGWWPDGLYTAPTDEALRYDIEMTKDLGYNMIRKHIKTEPDRWYYYCDLLGMIVWQDMPSGDRNPEWEPFKYFDGTELHRSAESEACYRNEWKEIIDNLYSHPCIGTWVPFNERWGQFKTQEIAEWTKSYDPSRLVNPASGGNHYTCGDILDIHHYPDPAMPLYDAARVNVVGEYGGIGWAVPGHLWMPDKNWGYVKYNSEKEVTDQYIEYANKLFNMIPKGCSAAVYTQTTDVEGEVNGLMTYDRKLLKVDKKRVSEANRRITRALDR